MNKDTKKLVISAKAEIHAVLELQASWRLQTLNARLRALLVRGVILCGFHTHTMPDTEVNWLAKDSKIVIASEARRSSVFALKSLDCRVASVDSRFPWHSALQTPFGA